MDSPTSIMMCARSSDCSIFKVQHIYPASAEDSREYDRFGNHILVRESCASNYCRLYHILGK